VGFCFLSFVLPFTHIDGFWDAFEVLGSHWLVDLTKEGSHFTFVMVEHGLGQWTAVVTSSRGGQRCLGQIRFHIQRCCNNGAMLQGTFHQAQSLGRISPNVPYIGL